MHVATREDGVVIVREARPGEEGKPVGDAYRDAKGLAGWTREVPPDGALTPRQIDLARHALGLDGRRSVSYRNRYVTGEGSPEHADWCAMVAAGHAGRRMGKTLPFGGDDMFWLTESGARAALQPGERLDPEDFPRRNRS